MSGMSATAPSSSRRRRKVAFVLLVILALLAGLVFTMDGVHVFPIIPPTPAYP